MESGSGSSANADKDAIVAMIFAIKAFEAKGVLTSFYDKPNDWAERSCTAFLHSNAVANDPVFDKHRLLKLGSCWGGWESNGKNPAHHSPGSCKVMHDFHAACEDRACSLAISNVNHAWNDLVEASSDFTGSRTPQWECGSEAAAVTWRVAFDAALCPDEMDPSAKQCLNPLLGSLNGGFHAAESSANDGLIWVKQPQGLLLF